MTFSLSSLLMALLLQAPVVESETVVTAPRSRAAETDTPAQHLVVDAEDLRRTQERSLPRALAQAANLWVQETNLGGGAPTIDGLIGNRVLLVLDGLRLNDATTRMVHQTLNAIDPAIVERVEILRGPSSVLYGSDAMGGAILIWTKRRNPTGAATPAFADQFHAETDLYYQSATDGGRGALTLSDALEDDGWLAVGAFQDWKDLRAGDNELQEFTGFHGNAFFGSWDHAFDAEHTLRATALVDREFDVPRTDRLVAGFGQTEPQNSVWHYKLQDHGIYQLTYDDTSEGAFTSRMQGRFSLRRYDEQREIQGLGDTELRQERDVVDSALLGLDWSAAAGEAHFLTWGLDLSTDWVDSTRENVDTTTGTSTEDEGAFADDSRYTSGAVFVQDEISAWSPLAITAGVRASYFDFSFEDFASNGGGREEGSFGALTGSLTAARDVSEGARVTGTLAQGFRAPNLEDLANNGSFALGEELANPDLDPESSTTLHAALDLLRQQWSASVGVYYTWIEDLIGRRFQSDGGTPTTPGDDVYTRDNVGRAQIFGVDAHGEHVLGGDRSPWSVVGAISYTLGRQYDDTIDTSTGTAPYDDVPFRRIPPLHGFGGLRWEAPEPGQRFGWGALELVWAATQDELNPDDEADPRIDPDGTEGWAVVNVDVGGELGASDPRRDGRARATWNAGVHNLLDENYRIHGSGFDAPGVGLVFGLRLSF